MHFQFESFQFVGYGCPDKAWVTIGGSPVTVMAPKGIDLTVALKSDLFQSWVTRLDRQFKFTMFKHRDPDFQPTMEDTEFPLIEAGKIEIQSMDMFGPRVGFMKIKADLRTSDGKFIPGISFLRGDCVAVLVVLECEDKEYTPLVVQPRAPAGSYGFAEIPAGMLDGSGDFSGVAAKELQEEVGITVLKAELQQLNIGEDGAGGSAPYASPGGSDERIGLYVCRKTVTREELDDIQGRCTGEQSEGEHITVKVVPLDDILTHVAQDMKSVTAALLYERVQAEKILRETRELLDPTTEKGRVYLEKIQAEARAEYEGMDNRSHADRRADEDREDHFREC